MRNFLIDSAAAALLATALLAGCTTMSPEDEIRALGNDIHRPDYISSDCARILADAQPIYDADRSDAIDVALGATDPRVAAIESRGAIMGCDPRR